MALFHYICTTYVVRSLVPWMGPAPPRWPAPPPPMVVSLRAIQSAVTFAYGRVDPRLSKFTC